MHLKISKERFLDLLLGVTNAIERKHNIPILSNVRILASGSEIVLTGSDLEVELQAKAALKENECIKQGGMTISAKKLLDICKSLPSNAVIDLKATKQRCTIKSGQSRFTVSIRPIDEYPLLNKDEKYELNNRMSIEINPGDLKRIFAKTAFCMAVQDVRFYLTGTLLEIDKNIIRAVTTDGHRLACSEAFADISNTNPTQVILPKKAITEIQRIIQPNSKRSIHLLLGREFLCATFAVSNKYGDEYSIEFTTKLIDAKYPDYRRVLPNNNNKIAKLNKTEFKEALQRVSILSNEKLRLVDMMITANEVELTTQDNDKNQAIEHVEASFNDDEFEISFDSLYLTEILNQMQSDQIEIHLSSPHSSVLLIDPDDISSKYVVMPRRV